MKARVDPSLWAAARIIENLAGKIEQVRAHVNAELNLVDSFPDHTPGASDPTGDPRRPLTGTCPTVVPIDATLDVWRTCGRRRPCGEHDSPVALTPVERAADRRLRLNLEYDDFLAQCRLIVAAASDALRSADSLIGTRLAGEKPRVVMRCCDGQVGKAGVFEWGDPTCTEDGVKSDMCVREYWRWYRWRKANGQPTAEIEDVA